MKNWISMGSQSGNALVVTLITTFAMALSMSTVAVYNTNVERNTQRSRLKALIANTEAQLRVILSTPSSYICNGNSGVEDCELTDDDSVVHGFESAMSQIEKLMGPLDPALCGEVKNAACGLELVGVPQLEVDATSNRPQVTVTFRYAGEDMGLRRDIEVKVQPGPEVFQDLTFNCNGFFEGFNEDGSVRCREIDTERAKPGDFISEVNPNTMDVKFLSLPDMVSDCAQPNKFVQVFQWTGSDTYHVDCGDRADPSAL